MNTLVSTLFLFSVLFPTKLWYAPDEAVTVTVKSDVPVKLVLVDFLGRVVDKKMDVEAGEKQVDVRQLYPDTGSGTYILYAVPQGKDLPNFVGTPLVIGIRGDKRVGAAVGPVVVKVEPLRYAEMETDAGTMKLAFFYDVAPNTVNNFLSLSEEGFYDSQVFHRIVKSFVLQAGDPLGRDKERAGTGGPGYMVDAEFNDRPHLKGVLSMARQGDPLERQGMMPRSEAANSASSQFFVCLDYTRTKALDGKYTVFGRVTDGMDVVDKLAAVPVGERDRPNTPPVIKKVTVKTVTSGSNPYEKPLTGE